LDAGAVEATIVLLRVASDVFDGFAAQFERHGISQGRFMVLMMLDRYYDRALLPSEVAEKIGVTRATVTGLLDGLERDGFVQRKAHPEDRRAVTVALTTKGRCFLDELLPGHYRRIAGLMANLDEDERKELVRLLAKVAAGTNALLDPNWDDSAPASATPTHASLTEVSES
jgi:DNA-binding MarR family transcriptional regulator